ncbi:LIM domain-containing protein, variant [Ditylenchus destructor]|uniref:LIM domain-containing protein, variant n=1 Tax=Ditylenchus destructor TaxID=166010 RepID=A0AAD4R9M8_9BILA|nr:LIM domain-containing protein, variant [Ditylenchus destructor]
MNFGSGPTKKFCHICRTWIDIFDEKIQVEKFTMHKSCFKCAICDCQLQPGSCSRDDGLMYRQFMLDKKSPTWFCHQHMMLGSGEKCQLLRQKYSQQNQG